MIRKRVSRKPRVEFEDRFGMFWEKRFPHYMARLRKERPELYEQVAEASWDRQCFAIIDMLDNVSNVPSAEQKLSVPEKPKLILKRNRSKP